MKKIVLASVSALALLTVAACSDTDNTTTQSVEPMEDQVPVTPAPQDIAPAAPEGQPMQPQPAPAE